MQQSYNNGQASCQRPVSMYSVQPQPAPTYGGQSQSSGSYGHTTSQSWSQPAVTQPAAQQPQQQQSASGYNPSMYGPMPGSQPQVPPPLPPRSSGNSNTTNIPYNSPPIPPPYTNVNSQSQQSWPQNSGHTSQTQPQPQGNPYGQATQPMTYPAVSNPQQVYNTAALPPPSQSLGGSYFPPTQAISNVNPQSNQASPSPAALPTVLSPNESHPAYIPPSLTGQGVASYMPANTNPQPGVYVPPPPDIPAWTQAQHAPLQGKKRFKYTPPAAQPTYQVTQPPAVFAQWQHPNSNIAQSGPTQQPQQYRDYIQQPYITQTGAGQSYGAATSAHPQGSLPVQQTYSYPPQGTSQPNWQPQNAQYSNNSPAQPYSQTQQQTLQSPSPVHVQPPTVQQKLPVSSIEESCPESPPLGSQKPHRTSSMSSITRKPVRSGTVSSISTGRSETGTSKVPDRKTSASVFGFSAGPSDWEHFELPADSLTADTSESKPEEELVSATITQPLDCVELPAHSPSPPPVLRPEEEKTPDFMVEAVWVSPSALAPLDSVENAPLTTSKPDICQNTTPDTVVVESLQREGGCENIVENIDPPQQQHIMTVQDEFDTCRTPLDKLEQIPAHSVGTQPALDGYVHGAPQEPAESFTQNGFIIADVVQSSQPPPAANRQQAPPSSGIQGTTQYTHIPQPKDLVPDLDPWYASSLQRYIVMLRAEATVTSIEHKMKAFKEFVQNEAHLRGIICKQICCPSCTEEPQTSKLKEKEIDLAQKADVPLKISTETGPHVPDADGGYSPGGRPILRSRRSDKEGEIRTHSPIDGGTVVSTEAKDRASFESLFRPYRNSITGSSSESSSKRPIHTPPSSHGDSSNTTSETPTRGSSQPQYKPFSPVEQTVNTAIEEALPHRASISFPTKSLSAGHEHEETFFPAPLSVGRNRTSLSDPSKSPSSSTTPHTTSAIEAFASILPIRPPPSNPSPNPRITAISERLAAVPNPESSLKEIRTRFDAWTPITYDEGPEDPKAAQQELLKRYVSEVFDPIYSILQKEIDTGLELMSELKASAEKEALTGRAMAVASASAAALSDLGATGRAPPLTLSACVRTLLSLHAFIERRHNLTADAVRERDGRYRRAQIAALNGSPDLGLVNEVMHNQLEDIEKRFQETRHTTEITFAEKKEERVRKTWELVKAWTREGVAECHAGTDEIIAGMERLLQERAQWEDSAEAEQDITGLVRRAGDTVQLAMAAESEALIHAFHAAELGLNAAEYQLSVAQARAMGAQEETLKKLAEEKSKEERTLREGLAKGIDVVKEDRETASQTVNKILGVFREKRERKLAQERKAKALEDAKRRNGDLEG